MVLTDSVVVIDVCREVVNFRPATTARPVVTVVAVNATLGVLL